MDHLSKVICAMVLAAAVAELALIGCGKAGLGGSAPASGGPPLPAVTPPILALNATPTDIVVSSSAPGTSSLSAEVVDPTTHLPAPGILVSFQAATGTLSTPVAVSDANGNAGAQLTVAAGTPPSKDSVTARAQGSAQSLSLPIADLATVTLSASPSFANCAGENPGLSVITALALDSANTPLAGVTIAFSADGGTLNPLAVTDTNGLASTTLSAAPGLPSTSIMVNAQAAGVTSSLTIPVTGCAGASPTATSTPGGGPSAMEFLSATPSQIGVLGSGLPQQSTLKFKLTDAGGAGVPGVTVNFSISSIGGESISPTSAITAGDGTVQTVLTSGRRATIVQVTAAAGSVLATSTAVAIVGGLPVQGRISESAKFVNIAGNVTSGLIDPLTILMADRFSNAVAPGTAVNLQSLGGGVSAPSPSDNNGSSTGALIAEAPTNPTDLNGVATGGVITVLASTRGETPFIDSNGNGVWDPGEIVIAVPEPFFDLNGNGVRDSNEPFIDLNGNHTYDNDQSGGLFSQNVVVFTSTRVTFSGATSGMVSPPSGFVIPNAGSQNFSLTLTDQFGNSLVAGTAYAITSAPAGTVIGGSGSVPDGQTFGALVSGLNVFSFTINDSNPGVNTAEPITVTVTVTSPPSSTVPGGNGSTSFQISGTMD